MDEGRIIQPKGNGNSCEIPDPSGPGINQYDFILLNPWRSPLSH